MTYFAVVEFSVLICIFVAFSFLIAFPFILAFMHKYNVYEKWLQTFWLSAYLNER